MSGRGLRLWSDPIIDEFPVLFREGFEKAFERFFQDPWISGRANGPSALAGFTPKLDVAESEREYVVTVELPGLEEKDVQVEVAKDVLILRGEKRQEREEKTKHSSWSERTYGSFLRRIPLGAEIDANKIAATMKQGVLTVTLPKSEQARQQTRKIEIKKA